MRDHRNLKGFQLADELCVKVYDLTRDFPSNERFGLTSQLRRSAVSIASNLVEGCVYDSPSQFAHFVQIAHGSARELSYQLELSQRLGYHRDTAILKLANETCRCLSGLRKAHSSTLTPQPS